MAEKAETRLDGLIKRWITWSRSSCEVSGRQILNRSDWERSSSPAFDYVRSSCWVSTRECESAS
jgi:hypothetical protein